jgi:hypothetical protein
MASEFTSEWGSEGRYSHCSTWSFQIATVHYGTRSYALVRICLSVNAKFRSRILSARLTACRRRFSVAWYPNTQLGSCQPCFRSWSIYFHHFSSSVQFVPPLYFRLSNNCWRLFPKFWLQDVPIKIPPLIVSKPLSLPVSVIIKDLKACYWYSLDQNTCYICVLTRFVFIYYKT